MNEYNDENVRAWAYDPDRDFIDDSNQDEDLLIGMLPAEMLIPLIADPGCPKGDVILQCLDANLRRSVLRGEAHHLEKVQQAADRANTYDQSKMRDWSALLRRRLEFRAGVGTVDEKTAHEMGESLLNGIGHTRPLDVSRTFWGNFLVQPNSETGTIRERLNISSATGRFKYSLRLSSGRRLY